MWFLSKKKNVKASKKEDMEHLTKDGELPWGWHTLNKEFTDQINAEYGYFLNNWLAKRNAAPIEQYETLKSFVLYMQDAQKLCYSKNECFAHWFDIIASPEYITERQAELKELEENFDQLHNAYIKRQSELMGLDIKVWDRLKQNNGILQADFLKLFDPSIKNDISNLLYQWNNAGKIERIKEGRSYKLHIKE